MRTFVHSVVRRVHPIDSGQPMGKKGQRNNRKANNKHKQSQQKNQKNARQTVAKSRHHSPNDTPPDCSAKSRNAEPRDAETPDMSSLRDSLPTDADCGPKTTSVVSTNYSPKGLHNLGNTCFLNSVLQVISETHLLFDLLNERANQGCVYRVKSIPNPSEWSLEADTEQLETTLDECLPLTQNLISFMREMRANGSRVVSPAKVLNSIRKEWSQFDGWAQQDSHELLRCLLDSLKSKEVKRQRRAVINQIKTDSQAVDTEDNNLDDDTKSRIKSYAAHTMLTPIDSVFGGQLLSSVCCDVCRNTSLTLEPFFDLSLPLSQLKNNFTTSALVDNRTNRWDPKTKSDDKKNEIKPEAKNLFGENQKNLTHKERKQLRSNKKAAKREAKQLRKTKNSIDISDNKENNGLNEVIEVIETTDSDDKNDDKQEVTNDNEEWPAIDGVEHVDQIGPIEGWNLTEPKTEEDFRHERQSVECDSHNNDEPQVPTDWTAQGQTLSSWNDIDPVHDIPEENEWSNEELSLEPLLGDFECTQDFKIEVWGDDEEVGVGLGMANEEGEDDTIDCINGLFAVDEQTEWPTLQTENRDTDWNDWNEDGWDPEGKRVFFGPALPASQPLDEDDEDKAHETDLQSILDLEAESLMSNNISDKEKLEIKQSGDQSNSSQEFDWHSKRVQEMIGICLRPMHSSDKLPNFDLLRLLANFTAVEALTGANKYLCEVCTKSRSQDGVKQLTNASKRALIAVPPPVLTLHLKRFEADGYRRSVSLKKISTFVSFPLTFDLSPFVSQMYTYLTPSNGQSIVDDRPLIYGLYGVVEHSGTLRSGHYTAYVKFRPNNARQVNKFSFIETFVAKVENVLKVIENNYFVDKSSEDQTSAEPTTNGCHLSVTNGQSSGSRQETVAHQEYSCSSDDCGKWFHISDSSVRSSSVSAVLKSNAYLLFYERIA